MTKFVHRLAMALLILPAAVVAAGADQKGYDRIMGDKSLYVGEGVVSLKSYDGDMDRAKRSARERARSAMAESMEVMISSHTTDTQKGGSTGSEEKIESASTSSSNLKIQDIRYDYFPGLPKEGQLTVLASVDRDDYRRQLAERLARLYMSQYGFRLMGGAEGGIGLTNSNGSGLVQMYGGGLDLIFKNYFIGYQLDTISDINLEGNEGGAALYASTVRLGYEVIPWAWRIQPYIPIQAEYIYWTAGLPYAQTFAASAGLGVRYWASDSVSLLYQVQWHQDLSGGEVYKRGGSPMLYADGSQAHVSMTGVAFRLGICWSGL